MADQALYNLLMKVSADTSEFNRKMKGTQRQVSGFQKQLRSMATMAAGAFSVGAIVNFTKQSIKAYDTQAKAEAALAGALKGRYDIQRDLMQQASRLQEETAGMFGDEQTIQAQALIAALGLQADQIKRLIPLIQDFAAVEEIGLKQAAQRVARAIGNGSDTLKRYGADLDVASSKAENAEKVINSLEGSIGGTAQTMGQAGASGIQDLSAAFGDLKEQIGAVATELSKTGGLTNLIKEDTRRLAGFNRALQIISSDKIKENTSWWERLRLVYTSIHADGEDLNKVLDNIAHNVEKSANSAALSTSAFQEQSRRYQENTNQVKEQIPLLTQLENQIKAVKEKRDNAITREQIARYNTRLVQLEDEKKKLMELQTVKRDLAPAPAKKSTGIFALDVDVSASSLDPMNTALDQNIDQFESWQLAVEDTVNRAAQTMVAGFSEMVGAAMVGGQTMKGIGMGLLESFAGVLERLGKIALTVAIGIEGIKKALQTLNPVVAAAAGVALIALAGAVRAGVSNMGEGIGKETARKPGINMAAGGEIPPGYPNDSYGPVWMSSEERVLPAPKSLPPGGVGGSDKIDVHIKWVQRGRDLVAVVDEVRRTKNN
jgi:hypothetical protein